MKASYISYKSNVYPSWSAYQLTFKPNDKQTDLNKFDDFYFDIQTKEQKIKFKIKTKIMSK
jgi:hypothetical protein